MGYFAIVSYFEISISPAPQRKTEQMEADCIYRIYLGNKVADSVKN